MKKDLQGVNIDFKKYENNLEKPKKELRLCPHCGTHFDHISKFCSCCAADVSEHRAVIEKRYNNKKEIYRTENERLINLFKEDCFRELGIKNHDFLDEEKMFDVAYSIGNTAGYYKVFYWLNLFTSFDKVSRAKENL